MRTMDKVRRHWTRGTLFDVIFARLGVMPGYQRVKWYGSDDAESSAAALAKFARIVYVDSQMDGWVMTIGNASPLHGALQEALRRKNVPFRSLSLERISD